MPSNLESLSGWRRFLDVFFCRWQWARRLVGGKWERWFVDAPVASSCWHPVTRFAPPGVYDVRPTPLCRSVPEAREEWPEPGIVKPEDICRTCGEVDDACYCREAEPER